jgi:hypothetical protein
MSARGARRVGRGGQWKVFLFVVELLTSYFCETGISPVFRSRISLFIICFRM